MTNGRPNEPRPRSRPPTARTGAPARTRSVAPRPDRPSRWRRVLRPIGTLGFALVPLVLLCVVAIGVAYVRLSHGPVSLKFLVPPIERGLEAELDGLRARVEDAVVILTEGGNLQFRLKNVRIQNQPGATIASAPLAAIEMSRTAFWQGRVVPSRVELIEPRLLLSYSDEQGLALSFTPVEADAGAPDPELARAPAEGPGEGGPQRIDISRALAEASVRARNGVSANAHLRQIGLRDARIQLEHAGRQTELRVPEASLNLEHEGRRSLVSGSATVASGRGPWTIAFQSEDSERAQSAIVSAELRGLVPSTLGLVFPPLALLSGVDLPVSADAKIELSPTGEVNTATLSVLTGRGHIHSAALAETPLIIDEGRIGATYDRARQRIDIAPSTVAWGKSRLTLAGSLTPEGPTQSGSAWRYEVRGIDGLFAAEEFAVAGVTLQSLKVTGRIMPRDGLVEIAEASLKAGGTELSVKGLVAPGASPPSADVEGRLSPSSVTTIKALWPRALAPGARVWVGEQVSRAHVSAGTFKYQSGIFLKDRAGATGDERISLAVEASDIQARPLKGMVPAEAPRALIRVENNSLEVTVPEAALVLGPKRHVPIKAGRLTAIDLSHKEPLGEIAFKIAAPLAPVIEVLQQPPLSFIKDIGVPLEAVEGKAEGQFKITLPLISNLKIDSVKIEGKARISDGKVKNVLAGLDVQDATIAVDVTDKAVDATGEVLLNGVVAKVAWQRILDAPDARQPPMRLTAKLDNSDRTQLGLDVNHFIQGEVPFVVTLARPETGPAQVHVHADLTAAELIIENIAWRKPPGRGAFLEFDIGSGKTYKTELQSLKLVGDDIAIEGWVGLGPDNQPREFHFPDFSINVVSRLDVQGALRADNVWDVKARGKTFDGREFFRALFSVGQVSEKQLAPQKPRAGVDLSADIDTVIGFSDTTLKGLKVKVSKRAGKLAGLDARGTLEGGAPVVAVLRHGPNEPRRLLADSTDAGRAFKLIGFYPNVQGGRVRLEVNLDGRGAAEKTGILWAEEFRILGDPVVSEVFSGLEGQGAAQGAAGGPGKPRVTRQVFDFDKMKVPFSVGHGQFVLEDSYLKGPLLGVSVRGKVDYKAQTVNLGGTYVPLQGLNNILGGIPGLGQLFSGPRGEGIFGITFAIQGPMANPQPIVNPLSLVAPGPFRELFQMAPFDPRVQAPDERKTKATPPEKRVRASSTPPASAKGAEPGKPKDAEVLDGWSSSSQPAPAQPRR